MFRLRRSTSRIVRGVVILLLLWCFFDIFRIHVAISEAEYKSIQAAEVYAAAKPDIKVFIASTHWNNEAILRSHWNDAVVDLVKHFGSANVYISIYESGSWDDTKGALRDLDKRLDAIKARRTIILDPTTHEDELANPPPKGSSRTGWVDTVRKKKELRRIPYLSKLRNRSLKPLYDLQREDERFDKILFLNDVVFSTRDVLSLLHTNNGHYTTACSLDFSKAPLYYDTFALRDLSGHATLTQTWPYFRDPTSRHAMERSQPVPVSSCWNGMVFMDAAPFYGDSETDSRLEFRGIPDDLAGPFHLEGSECCLIHADNARLSPAYKGAWLNPTVRVGYNLPAYRAVHPHQGHGHSTGKVGVSWVSFGEIAMGLWSNRVLRWTTTDWFTRYVVKSRVKKWERQKQSNSEHAVFCVINELQVLVHNGWAHV